jgi:hypothetical protein
MCIGTRDRLIIVGEVVPANFQLIDLSNANLQIVTVGNDGTEVKHTATAFGHYRIELEKSAHDVRLWDKYFWDAYDPVILPNEQNPGIYWEKSP